jgi:hypothetical protein
MNIVHFVHIQMRATHKDIQPVNLASAAQGKFSFVIKDI